MFARSSRKPDLLPPVQLAAHRMEQSIPGSALEILPECGHRPQHEHAARFNDLALKFLA